MRLTAAARLTATAVLGLSLVACGAGEEESRSSGSATGAPTTSTGPAGATGQPSTGSATTSDPTVSATTSATPAARSTTSATSGSATSDPSTSTSVPSTSEESPDGGEARLSLTADPADLPTFASPSGNIACMIGPVDVRCDILDRDWEPQRADLDPDCEFSQSSLTVADGPARVACVSDSVFGSGMAGSRTTTWWRSEFGTVDARIGSDLAVLPHGYTLKAGDHECTSARAGVTCFGPKGSFFLSKETYDLRRS